MTDKEIIKNFFNFGCKDKHGKPLPLRNCEKIRSLYERDLKEMDCCSGAQYEIHQTYQQRLKTFLAIEKL